MDRNELLRYALYQILMLILILPLGALSIADSHRHYDVMCHAGHVGPILCVSSLLLSDMECSWRAPALSDSYDDTTRLLAPQNMLNHQKSHNCPTIA
jgi:hypothetical protein